ncbi:hypothetical protein [Marinobacter arenosus]|uniref:hypothetical protein n=1 Tax=Marinobacter arenosus TaxID=2856822 RepID=UPI001C4A8204|nr:hypothetical protein [Marinobacter arenosus]MBW0147497.1 hypothetical protein [Marinobacter arenosus]
MSTRRTTSLFERLAEREKAPETHLFKTVGFWLAIAPPLLIGIGLAVYAGITEGKVWTLTTDGYNSFLKDFKLPIAIMGLSIPLGALAAAVHRSMQTSRQIIEQNQQNIFSNYLEHRKYFLDYVAEHAPFKRLKISAPHLYQRLFPKSAEGPLEPANKSISEFLEEARYVADRAKKCVNGSLTKKRFKIIDSLLASSMERSTNQLRKLIDVPEFDPQRVTTDPLQLLAQTLRQNEDGAKGLVECANFHKTYRAEEDFSELESDTQFCIERIESMLKLYNLWRMIVAETSEDTPSNPNSTLSQRLENVRVNMKANLLTTEDFEVIFKHHLTDKEQQIILESGPTNWRIIGDSIKTSADIADSQ